jgi:hypothetical protein
MKKKTTTQTHPDISKLFVIKEDPQTMAIRQAQELREERESDEEHMKHCPHCHTQEDLYLCYLQKALIKAFQIGHSEDEVLREVRRMWRGFR